MKNDGIIVNSVQMNNILLYFSIQASLSVKKKTFTVNFKSWGLCDYISWLTMIWTLSDTGAFPHLKANKVDYIEEMVKKHRWIYIRAVFKRIVVLLAGQKDPPLSPPLVPH